MAYCTAAQVKSYLGITTTGDDTLIGNIIPRAQAFIDQYTNRAFEVTSNTSRYYTVGEDTDGAWLHINDEIASISAIVTNADATSGGTTLTTGQYITAPRNFGPYHGIKILSSSNLDWDYTNNAEMGVKLTGKFGYSTGVPSDIEHAAIRMAAYYYRQKDAQVFDVTAIPDAGVITVPQGLPADVVRILNRYKRRAEF